MRHSAVVSTWISTPASPPTTVPLMRMNCRSRPTCSSTRRLVSWPSHLPTVSVISSTIQRWDGRQAADRIELHVGRDLQFIRINGTVVGGLAGLALHAIAQVAG